MKTGKNTRSAKSTRRRTFQDPRTRIHQVLDSIMHESSRTVRQLQTNCDFLMQRMDAVHALLCPGQMGTWQQRAEQVLMEAKRLTNERRLKQHSSL